MTNDRSGKAMGKTAMGYIEQWYKEQLYNRRKEINSKYLHKGTTVESAAIQYFSEIMEVPFEKNEQYFENDYICGTPDIIINSQIIEIKSSWDCFTFPLFDKEIDKKYWWQCQGYMALTDKKQAQLVYLLMSATDDIIESEAWREAKRRGLLEVDYELYTEVQERMSYDSFPPQLRIKPYIIEYDPAAVEAIQQRVIECRQYLEMIKIQ